MYDVQVAYSGLAPVGWLPKLGTKNFTQCIGILANYNQLGSTPGTNRTLVQYGYNVRSGGSRRRRGKGRMEGGGGC